MYKAHWRHLIPLAAVFYLLIALVSVLLTMAFGWVGALLSGLLSLVGVFWLQGALTEAVADLRDGRADLSIKQTFARVLPLLGTLFLAGLLAVLGIGLGLLLLIVPGLLLLTWWSVITPVIVLERKGVLESFGRSRELVRGHGWTVFGVIILTILILIGVGLLIGLALLWLPEEARSFVRDAVGGALTAPFTALAWTLMYFKLREPEPEAEPALVAA